MEIVKLPSKTGVHICAQPVYSDEVSVPGVRTMRLSSLCGATLSVAVAHVLVAGPAVAYMSVANPTVGPQPIMQRVHPLVAVAINSASNPSIVCATINAAAAAQASTADQVPTPTPPAQPNGAAQTVPGEGCVLPVVDAVPTPPTPPAESEIAPLFPLLPLLAAAGAAGTAAAIASSGDDGSAPASPS